MVALNAKVILTLLEMVNMRKILTLAAVAQVGLASPAFSWTTVANHMRWYDGEQYFWLLLLGLALLLFPVMLVVAKIKIARKTQASRK